jgi:hypothetical protein
MESLSAFPKRLNDARANFPHGDISSDATPKLGRRPRAHLKWRHYSTKNLRNFRLLHTILAKGTPIFRTLRLTASGCDQARVVHKPRLLSGNEPSYVSGELARAAGP